MFIVRVRCSRFGLPISCQFPRFSLLSGHEHPHDHLPDLFFQVSNQAVLILLDWRRHHRQEIAGLVLV